MPNYDVHLYPIVHIKVLGVKAESMKEAIKRTLDTLDWHRLLASKQNFSDIAYIEFAEGFDSFLVDVVGDSEFTQSKWFTKNINPVRK